MAEPDASVARDASVANPDAGMANPDASMANTDANMASLRSYDTILTNRIDFENTFAPA